MKLHRPNVALARQLDQQLIDSNLKRALSPGNNGWISQARQALGASQVALAEVLGVTHQAVQKLESRELSRQVTLLKLHELADQLDCDLVYGFTPRGTFSERAQMLEERQNQAERDHKALPMWSPLSYDELDQRALRVSMEGRSDDRKDYRQTLEKKRRRELRKSWRKLRG